MSQVDIESIHQHQHMNYVSKIYETTLELLFEFENILNVECKSIVMHFNRASNNNGIVTPYYIVIFDSNNTKYTFNMEQFVELLQHIPRYKLSEISITEFNLIRTDNRLCSINPTDKVLSILRPIYDESFTYESRMTNVDISDELIDKLIDILVKHNIDIDWNDEQIIIYNQSASYHIVIPKHHTIDTSTSYCITPSPHDFGNTVSIGIFNYYKGNHVKQSCENHLALIKSCIGCHKNIIVNWQEFGTINCPYCLTHNDSNI